MSDNTSIAEMSSLIAFFLERQRVVALAMLDIHPGPLQMAGTHILGIEIEPYIRAWRAKMDTDKRFARNWQTGVWRGEWKHFAHGFGCLLTNLRTGEPIEWDAPDLQAFENWWFWNHLEWQVKREMAPHIAETRLEQLRTVFQAMCESGLLMALTDHPSKLTFGQNRQNPD